MSIITSVFSKPSAQLRFWDKVIIPANPDERANDCWIWVGSLEGRQPRYHTRFQGKNVTLSPARIAYILYYRGLGPEQFKVISADPTFDVTEDLDITRQKWCLMTRECMNPLHMGVRRNGKLARRGTYEWRYPEK